MSKIHVGGDMDATFDFLSRLSDNNNRPWFKENKTEYDAIRLHWISQLQRMIDTMTEWEPAVATVSAASATYRIYRDTRFSPDKTPYKTHIGASINPPGCTPHCGYYIEFNPEAGESGLYGGIWCPDSETLKKLRHAIVDNIEEWEEIVSDPELRKLYPGWCGPALKTIPKGWDKNHPQAEYLRLKSYGKFHPLDRKFFDDKDWPLRAAELMRPLKPLVDFLDYSVKE